MGDLYLLPAFRDTPDRVRGLVESTPVTEWSYLGSDTLRRIALERALGGSITWHSLAKELEETSRRLRRPFLELIDRLERVNAGPFWWGSSLATQNPYTSSLFLQCCFLAIGRDLLREKGGSDRLLVVEGGALLRGLVALAGESGVPVGHLTSALDPGGRPARMSSKLRNLRSIWGEYLLRRAVLRRSGMETISSFGGPGTALILAWIDHRNFAPDGGYREPHLGDALPRHLRASGYRVGYLARVLGGFRFKEAVERLRATGEVVFFPEALLRPGDVARTLLRALRYRPLLPRPVLLERLDITELVEEQTGEDLTLWFSNLYYHDLVRRLPGAGVIPELLFHTMEGHGWERVLGHAVRTFLPTTELVACNTGTYSSMLLCMYVGEAENGSLPRRIVTNGPLMADLLRGTGYPSSSVVAGAELRTQHLWERPPLSERPPRAEVVRVLVAGEIGFSRSVELVDKALRAFAGRSGYEVIVNSHPRTNLQELLASVSGYASSNVRIEPRNVDELLPEADALIYAYSGVCFEALRYGVPPVFVKAEGWLNLDQLENAPQYRRVATTPEEIRRAVDEIVGLSDVDWWRWYRGAQEVLAQHVAPPTPELLDRFVRSRRRDVALRSPALPV